MSAGIKANVDGSAAIQVGGTDVITLTSGGAATFVTSPTTVQAGTAAAPSITFSGDTDTGIFSPGANTLAFSTNGTEDARFDSAGNFGLAVTPSAWQSGAKAIQVNSGGAAISALSGSGALNVTANCYYNGTNWIYSNSYFATRYFNDDGNHIWYTAPSGTAGNAITFTERARITSGGDVGIGTGSPGAKLAVSAGNATGFRVDTSTANESLIVTGSGSNLQVRHPAAGVELFNSAGNAFRIVALTNGVSLAANGTSWGAISDERLKDIIEPITNASEKVASLRAVIGKYKTDEEGVRRSFLIAQDVNAVLPEAVVTSSENDDTLLLQYTDTIPLLVAAIKEQQAMIEEMKAEIAALKAQP